MIYVIVIIGILLIILIKLVVVDKLRIKWRTFFKKGFIPNRQNFGLYTYTGNQGKGKTYSLIEYIYDNRENCVFFGNIKDISCVTYISPSEINNRLKNGLKCLSSGNYVYFNGFNGLVLQKKLLDFGFYDDLIQGKQIVFVFDELFTELQKKSTLSLEVQDFLCQLRKRRIIFLTTAQVWSEVPLYFRRLCRFQIDCNMFPFFGTGLLIKKFNDAENMKWDEELQEHTAPTIELSLSKTRKVISNCYDTRERILKDDSSSADNELSSSI